MAAAVIVGGSRGIGAACARRLRADGFHTWDLSRTSGCDVSKRDDLDAALAKLGAEAPDVVVYSAGHVEPQAVERVDSETFDYHLEVNLRAAWRCLTWFAGLDRPGTVVLVASTAALRPSPGWSAYSTAKAALVNLGLTAAVELAPKVRVYVVAPGRCATHLRAALAPGEDQTQIMQPVEVADVVSTLVADTAGVLTGQVVEVARRW